jgi:hypothetical protein
MPLSEIRVRERMNTDFPNPLPLSYLSSACLLPLATDVVCYGFKSEHTLSVYSCSREGQTPDFNADSLLISESRGDIVILPIRDKCS